MSAYHDILNGLKRKRESCVKRSKKPKRPVTTCPAERLWRELGAWHGGRRYDAAQAAQVVGMLAMIDRALQCGTMEQECRALLIGALLHSETPLSRREFLPWVEKQTYGAAPKKWRQKLETCEKAANHTRSLINHWSQWHAGTPYNDSIARLQSDTSRIPSNTHVEGRMTMGPISSNPVAVHYLPECEMKRGECLSTTTLSLVARLYEDGSVKLWCPNDKRVILHCLAPPLEEGYDGMMLADVYAQNPLRLVVCLNGVLVRLPDLTVWYLVAPADDGAHRRVEANANDGWLLGCRSPPTPRSASSRQALLRTSTAEPGDETLRLIPRTEISAAVAVDHLLFLGGLDGSVEGVDPTDARLVFRRSSLRRVPDTDLDAITAMRSTSKDDASGLLCGTASGGIRSFVLKRHVATGKPLFERWVEEPTFEERRRQPIRCIATCLSRTFTGSDFGAVTVWDSRSLKPLSHHLNTIAVAKHGFSACSILVHGSHLYVGEHGGVFVFDALTLQLRGSLLCGHQRGGEKVVDMWIDQASNLRCLLHDGCVWTWRLSPDV